MLRGLDRCGLAVNNRRDISRRRSQLWAPMDWYEVWVYSAGGFGTGIAFEFLSKAESSRLAGAAVVDSRV